MEKSSVRRNGTCNSVSAGKHNRWVMLPGNVGIAAEALERRNQNWIVRAEEKNDLVVQVGDSSFLLHKLPMVSRSAYLNRLVLQRSSGGIGSITKVQIEDFPGGAEVMEIVVRFCYGWKVGLNAGNIAPVYCAAHFLEMDDGLEKGNLISKAEVFLSFVLHSSWKDLFQILRSCESISPGAKELRISKRCCDAIGWEACRDLKAFAFYDHNVISSNAQATMTGSLKHGGIAEDWWFEDVLGLPVDQFTEVIESIKRKGMEPVLIGSCITKWTERWLSQVPHEQDHLSKHQTHSFLRFTTECLIRVLPEEENSISCNFMLHLLKLGMMVRINLELSDKLERRIASTLEKCSHLDLLVKSYANNGTLYDVGIITRVVEAYVSSAIKSSPSGIIVVGRLVDGYLALVARDCKLSSKEFQSLANALPKNARYRHDGLYTAMDLYLKAHPRLTKEERTELCTSMDYNKLSPEARKHAIQNDRLPVDLSTRLILLEQESMTRTMIATAFNSRRTQPETVIRIGKGSEKGWITPRDEIKMMKKDVYNMKVQLKEMQTCKMQLQRLVKRCAT